MTNRRPRPVPFAAARALAPTLALLFAGHHLRGQSTEVTIALPAEARPVPPDVFARIRSEAVERSQVMEHLDHLTNRIGPRLTGSDNCTNACEWAAQRFKSFGIENARTEKWGTCPVGWTRGQWIGEVTKPEPMTLHFGTEAWTAGTKGPVEAAAILEPTDEELDDKMDKLKGAWIVRKRAANSGGAERDRLYKEIGIAGIVRPTSGIDANYPLQIRVFGSWRGLKWDNLPTIPVVHLRQDQHNRICRMFEEGKEVRLRFDIRNYFKQGPVDLLNVIADIRGSEKPDEYVVVGGHIDSWHQATGTTDNGTGTATTLEAARILTAIGARPRRTIRFMLWSGEEQGLLGSDSFVKRNRTDMNRYSAAFIHDTGTNFADAIRVTADMKDAMELVFAPILELDDGMPFTISTAARLSGGGSDHASFLSARVPGFSWSQNKGRAVYGRTWHSQWDTYDAAIPAYQQKTAMIAATAALGVANLPELLPRVDTTGGFANMNEPITRALGVECEGLTITKVLDTGWAKEHSLAAGDEILRIDDEEVQRLRDVARLFREQPDQPAKLVVKRKGQELALTVKKAKMPEPVRRGGGADSRPGGDAGPGGEMRGTPGPASQPAIQRVDR